MEFKDYYKILAVNKNSPKADIKKSFRKLARKYHPDVSSEKNAQEKFKEINEAYEVLKNATKKAEYDELIVNRGRNQHHYQQNSGQQHHYQSGSGAEQEDFSDFFASMFGEGGQYNQAQQPQQERNVKGRDTHYALDVSLEDSFNGTSRTIQMEALSLDKEGMVVSAPKTLNIKIPKGMTEGKSIRLKNQGHPSVYGGENGDLYIKIHILTHKIFSLDGGNINVVIPLTPWEAALGASIKVPTLKGQVNLKVPQNTKAGKKLRLKGYGLTEKHDQYVQFKIVNPKIDSDADKAQYHNLAKHFTFNPRSELGV